MKYEEHKIQQACINWFKYIYPKYRGVIFHIANERKQSARAGGRLKSIGQLSGVADVFISVPNEKYHGYYIEFKSSKGKQTENQNIFQDNVCRLNYKYDLVNNFNDF
jgi:hypothetical protein